MCGVPEGRCPCGGLCTAVFAALRCKGEDLYEGALLCWDVGLVVVDWFGFGRLGENTRYPVSI